MFTPHNMSHVMCHVSHVTCHMSHVICHMSRVTCHVSHVLIFFFTKWWSLSVEGLLSTGPTPSSFLNLGGVYYLFCRSASTWLSPHTSQLHRIWLITMLPCLQKVRSWAAPGTNETLRCGAKSNVFDRSSNWGHIILLRAEESPDLPSIKL